MPLQPRHHLGMLMGAVVVQHGVDPAPWTKGPRPSGAGQLPSEPTRATSRYGQAGRLSPVVTRDQAPRRAAGLLTGCSAPEPWSAAPRPGLARHPAAAAVASAAG